MNFKARVLTSSSRSSKTLIRSWGMSSEKPVMNASNCSLTRLWTRYSMTALQEGVKKRSKGEVRQSHHLALNSLHIFLFVLLRHGDIFPSRFQIDRDQLSKSILGCSERFVDDALDVIFPAERSISRISAYAAHAITHSIQVMPRCSSASTLSKSLRLTFLCKIIL